MMPELRIHDSAEKARNTTLTMMTTMMKLPILTCAEKPEA